MKKILLFLKPLYVTCFFILVVECFQLYSAANYLPPYLDGVELLLMTSVFLFLALVFSLALGAVLTLLEKILSRSPSVLLMRFPLAATESVSAAAILCAYIPLFILPITGSFPLAMKIFWKGGMSVWPVLILSLTGALRFFFPAQARKLYYGVVDTVWKPVIVISIAAFLWVGLSAVTSSEPPPLYDPATAKEKPWTPNIIIVTFDGMSARDMSLYGYGLKTTPFIDEFAKKSFVFERMHANYNRTVASTASIVTGKRPWTHRAYRPGEFISKEKRRENVMSMLPDYFTAAVSPSKFVYAPFLGLGGEFDFATWSNLSFHPILDSLDGLLYKVGGMRGSHFSMPLVRHFIHGDKTDYDAETFTHAARMLSERNERPVFLWVHIWPPHDPYNAPPPYSFTFLSDENVEPLKMGPLAKGDEAMAEKTRLLYDEYILFADAALKRFMGMLMGMGLFDTSIIVISSDHGDIFEKGWVAHTSPFLYESEIHTPLIIRLPGQTEGRRIKANAEHVDIAPTLLDLLERPIPEWMEGETLTPYMLGLKEQTDRTKFSMVFHSFYNETDHRVKTVAAFRGDFKLIYDIKDNEVELYDLSSDPEELRDISRDRPEITLELKKEIEKNLDKMPPAH